MAPIYIFFPHYTQELFINTRSQTNSHAKSQYLGVVFLSTSYAIFVSSWRKAQSLMIRLVFFMQQNYDCNLLTPQTTLMNRFMNTPVVFQIDL